MDYNELRKDTEIGVGIFELSKLEEDATREDLLLSILKDGKRRGELRLDVEYFPILKPMVNESGVEELPESSELRLHIVSAIIHIDNHTRRRGHCATYNSSGQGS